MSKLISISDERYASEYRDQYLVFLTETTALPEFLERCHVVHDSYAGKIVTDIWRGLYLLSVDVRLEFDLYYKLEYNDFSEFLACNYTFPDFVVQGANRLYNSYRYIFYYKPYQGFLHEAEGATLLRALISEKYCK